MSQHFDDHIHMMERLGGSFVRSLASCYYAADSTNKARLLAAFPDYFGKYREQFEQWRRAQEVQE